MDIKIKNMEKYKEVINGRIALAAPSGANYVKYNETEQYRQALEKYKRDYENAENTMAEMEFEKWETENDPPDMPQEIRYIPRNENWDTVNSLIEKSIELKTDLLWDRYKDNLMDYESNVY